MSTLKVTIENYKSIRKLELELGKVTILIGPPAAGKSNILEAIALVGYARRVSGQDPVYADPHNVRPLLRELLRVETADDAFPEETLP